MDDATQPTEPEKVNEVPKEAPKEEETKSLLQQTNEAVTRLEEANKVKEGLLEREEKLQSDTMLGGISSAGQAPPKKEKLNDIAYAEALVRGEVNPFQEDGY